MLQREKKNVNLRGKKGMGEQSRVLREESAGRRQNRNYYHLKIKAAPQVHHYNQLSMSVQSHAAFPQPSNTGFTIEPPKPHHCISRSRLTKQPLCLAPFPVSAEPPSLCLWVALSDLLLGSSYTLGGLCSWQSLLCILYPRSLQSVACINIPFIFTAK